MTLKELCETCGSGYLPVRVWDTMSTGDCVVIEEHERMDDLLRLNFGKEILDREVYQFFINNSQTGLIWNVTLKWRKS